jgi:anti-sigma regulatory factor (Ser/Thr protein kinase)
MGRRDMTVFPSDVRSVAAARAFVAQTISHCRQETIDVARLLTSELATNALIHAQSAFDVAAYESDGVVHVEITDGSSIRPEPIAARQLDPHGRGLYLVEELSSEWGVVDAPPGKTVWFDLRCRGNS